MTCHFPRAPRLRTCLTVARLLARVVADSVLVLSLIMEIDWGDSQIVPKSSERAEAVDLHWLKVAFCEYNGIVPATVESFEVMPQAPRASGDCASGGTKGSAPQVSD